MLVNVPLEPRIKALPPLEEHGLADELEPGREFERRVLKKLAQLVGAHVFRVAGLIGIGHNIDLGLDEENVVN